MPGAFTQHPGDADQLIQDNAAELRLLGELQVVREKEMAVGTGIEYPTASGSSLTSQAGR